MCYDVYFLKLSPDYFDRIIKYGMDTKKYKDNQTDGQRQNIIFSHLRYGEHMTTAPLPPQKKKKKKKNEKTKKKKTSISDTVIKRMQIPET